MVNLANQRPLFLLADILKYFGKSDICEIQRKVESESSGTVAISAEVRNEN